ncbi:MAG: hypothetical protein ACI9BD_001470, partial [Candidatus Marinamargulisbacteria bacterium]
MCYGANVVCCQENPDNALRPSDEKIENLKIGRIGEIMNISTSHVYPLKRNASRNKSADLSAKRKQETKVINPTTSRPKTGSPLLDGSLRKIGAQECIALSNVKPNQLVHKNYGFELGQKTAPTKVVDNFRHVLKNSVLLKLETDSLPVISQGKRTKSKELNQVKHVVIRPTGQLLFSFDTNFF